MNLNKKIIVVTGSEGLIGREIVTAIQDANGIAIRTDIKVKKNEKNYIHLDINSKKSIINCINTINATHGRIDALINNAYPRNPNYGRKFEDVELKDFNENTALHLGGYFLTSQQFLLAFKKQGFGNIINISSIYGCVAPDFSIYEGTPMTMPPEYAVIKSGIIHLTKYIASYYKGHHVRCNAISPGGIFDHQPSEFIEKYTKKCLNHGMLEKEDIKGIIQFLLSDASKFINGQNIIIDDGFTV